MGKIKRFFSDYTETREDHDVEAYQTRYYKAKHDVIMKKIEEIINNSSKYKILSISTERGEMSATIKGNKKGLIVFSIFAVRPFRTAIDISVSFNTAIGIDFGKSGRVIKSLYEEIDKHFEYIGSGLVDKI